MALGQLVTIMRVKRVNGHAVGEGSPCRTCHAPVPPDCRPATGELPCRMIADDARQLCTAAASCYAQRIGKAADSLIRESRQQAVKRGVVNEINGAGHELPPFQICQPGQTSYDTRSAYEKSCQAISE